MYRPDAVVLKDDRTVIVVEAKSRTLSGPVADAVRTQLQQYSTSVNSPWVVVIDPQQTEVFHLNQPVALLSTGDVIGAADRRPSIVGESTLLFAFDRWLHKLSEHPESSAQPELTKLAKELGRDWTIRYATSSSTSDDE